MLTDVRFTAGFRRANLVFALFCSIVPSRRVHISVRHYYLIVVIRTHPLVFHSRHSVIFLVGSHAQLEIIAGSWVFAYLGLLGVDVRLLH